MKKTGLNIEKLKKIKVLFLDVDGVLTDGGIYLFGKEEARRFHTKDEGALKYLIWNGIDVVLISGNKSEALKYYAEKVGIKNVFDGTKVKLPVVEAYIKEKNLKWEEVAYMGDDLIDLPSMLKAGVSFAPADAFEEVRNRADKVTNLPGGYGAVREAAELILRAMNKYEELLSKYLNG